MSYSPRGCILANVNGMDQTRDPDSDPDSDPDPDQNHKNSEPNLQQCRQFGEKVLCQIPQSSCILVMV